MTDAWKRQIDRLHEGLVRRADPTEWVIEADAVDASRKYPHVALRGPVFGIATQDAADGAAWRLLTPVTQGTPQDARDTLHSMLWFRAKDDTDDRAVRRALLAAVAVLEREPADELEILGVRHRVVRGDEFARSGDDGLEPPRPTDPEPARVSWEERPYGDDRSADVGFALDPDRETGFMAGAMRLALRGFAYTGARFPADVRRESERAVRRHPDVVLLPVGFAVAERNGTGWRPRGALRATPHDARLGLYHAMTEVWPLVHEFDEPERKRYARAAETLRKKRRVNDVRVGDRLFRVCRVERFVRCGPDGPEPPRPSDLDAHEPMRMHPRMDEDGTVHHDD
ncbi:DUF5954 family protein [Streptomyces sp. TRM64462]|uniref:DUF5954 family protein n=1 Tax=Streptomyces sp. TRM64462 TaxID=2741726 RepID=UPI0015860915|nr:DUF5954 family protein [Streptomyces sp. TRM64462]